MEAIRKQVDDYFTEPADISVLVSALKEKSRRPHPIDQIPGKRAAAVMIENCEQIVERWLKELSADPRLTAIRITNAERIDGLPLLLNDLAKLLETGETQISCGSLSAAAVHGAKRAKQEYTIPLLVAETRILNR